MMTISRICQDQINIAGTGSRFLFQAGGKAMKLISKNVLLLILICAVVLSGCANAVWDDSTDSNRSGIRLLVNGTNRTTLSDLSADDWAPNIAELVTETNTNRWLYFVSERTFPGKSERYGVFRAREVEPAVFTGLELVWQTNVRIDNLVVGRNAEPGSDPLMLVEYNENGQQVFKQLSWDFSRTNYTAQDVFVLSMEGATTNDFYLGGKITLPEYGTEAVLIRSSWYSWFGEGVYPLINSAGNLVEVSEAFQFITNVTPFPLGLLLRKIAGYTGTLDGTAPVLLPRPGDPARKVFALAASLNGRLVFAYNRNLASAAQWLTNGVPPVEYRSNSFFDGERILQLGMLEHPPGSRDITPSADPVTGLYFASDRNGGVLNLYYIPWRELFSAWKADDSGSSTSSAASSSSDAASFSSAASSSLSISEPFTNGQQANSGAEVAVDPLPDGFVYWLAADSSAVGEIANFVAGESATSQSVTGSTNIVVPSMGGIYYLYLVDGTYGMISWKSAYGVGVLN